MPLVSSALVLAFAIQAPVFTAPPDLDMPVSSPCPTEKGAAVVPANGVGSPVPPRLRKHVAGRATTEFHQQIEGDAKVWVSAVVDKDGRPCDLRVVRVSHPDLGLEQSSLDAVTQWEFAPATQDGTPVRKTITIELGYSSRRSQTGGRDRVTGADAHVPDPLLKASRPRIPQMTPP